jgi:hypothetical protein
MGKLAARRRGDHQGAVPGDRVDAAQGVVGLPADRLHLLGLGGEVKGEHLVARRLVRPAVVDRVGDAGLVQGHRGVGHHRGASGDAGQHGRPRGVAVVDDLNAESVLFQGDDGGGQRLVIGQ